MRAATNRLVLQGKWKQLRGRGRQWWGRLTHDASAHRAGRVEELMGVVQERYGFTHQKAARHVDRILRHLPRGS